MIEIREAQGDGEVQAAMAVRHAVFVEEQGVPVDLEADGRDGEAAHLVAVRDGDVLATCRLIAAGDTVSLGRLAVDAAARHQGIAGRILRAAEAWARARGARRLTLSAQTYASALYLAAGYHPIGEPFVDAGIEHVDKELDHG